MGSSKSGYDRGATQSVGLWRLFIRPEVTFGYRFVQYKYTFMLYFQQ
jgi:hypothetical protein